MSSCGVLMRIILCRYFLLFISVFSELSDYAIALPIIQDNRLQMSGDFMKFVKDMGRIVYNHKEDKRVGDTSHSPTMRQIRISTTVRNNLLDSSHDVNEHDHDNGGMMGLRRVAGRIWMLQAEDGVTWCILWEAYVKHEVRVKEKRGENAGCISLVNGNNNLITQKAALRDVLMMKLVSYYEDKYKLSNQQTTVMPKINNYVINGAHRLYEPKETTPVGVQRSVDYKRRDYHNRKRGFCSGSGCYLKNFIRFHRNHLKTL